jgi:hypothetical protein
MKQRFAKDQRSGARVAVAVEVQLLRRRGNGVLARTRDLSVGGAGVVSSRPLRVDEELRFHLELPAGGPQLTGTARVLRQHRRDTYALRFEHLPPAISAALGAWVEANAGAPV